jgi:hypothetical protein
MKIISLIIITLFANNALALTFNIINLCDNSLYLSKKITVDLQTNIGEISIKTFNDNQIPYIGSIHGMNSILNTLTGTDAYEVLADNHMRVYGWCYEVNGIQPSILTSEYKITKNSNDNITWFYGYAELINNDWISYCTPVYSQPHPFVCQN